MSRIKSVWPYAVFIICIIGLRAYWVTWQDKYRKAQETTMRKNEAADIERIRASDYRELEGKRLAIIDAPKEWRGKRDQEINPIKYREVMLYIQKCGYKPYCRNFITNRMVVVLIDSAENKTELPKAEIISGRPETLKYIRDTIEPRIFYQDYDEEWK